MTHFKSSNPQKKSIDERRKTAQITATTDSALPNNIKLVQKSFPQKSNIPIPERSPFYFPKISISRINFILI